MPAGCVRAKHRGLAEGAEAIRGDLPAASTLTVEVPLGAGSSQGTAVHRLSSLEQVRDRMTQSLDSLSGTVITVGGDCAVDLASIPLYAAKALSLTMGLYVVYLALAVWGLIDWQRARRVAGPAVA